MLGKALSHKKASIYQAKSLNPSPRRQRNTATGEQEMNSDIMILISKPRGVSKIDPLRLHKSLASSSESILTSDNEGSPRKNFNYPPDLRTA